MANLIEHLTSISTKLRSGPSPGRRVMALALCAMLILSGTLPAVAFAGEADSEGTGTAPPIEAPGAPDFDPGGEEASLEDVPASGGAEEGGTVEVEPEVDLEAPTPAEVTSVDDVAEVEDPQPQPVEPPAVSSPEPEPEPPVRKAATEPSQSEPVANSSLVAPTHKSSGQKSDHEQASPTAAVTSTDRSEEEPPSSTTPQPQAATPVDSGRSLAGKRFYTVQRGDCLWHIAAALLPGADEGEIAGEVARLWQLNEERIGTGDPNLIYAGTELRLR